MSKKDLVDKAEFEKAVGLRSGFMGTMLSLLKFALAIILLPLVAGLTKSFHYYFIYQGQLVVRYFYSGVIAYIILHLFIYKPQAIYDFGQHLIGRMFSFLKPLRSFAYSCLPAYALVTAAVYFIVTIFAKDSIPAEYFVFLISFFGSMHLVLTAVSFRQNQGEALKGDYLFNLIWLYIIGLIIITALIKSMLRDFPFNNFIMDSYIFFLGTIKSIWNQFFVLN